MAKHDDRRTVRNFKMLFNLEAKEADGTITKEEKAILGLLRRIFAKDLEQGAHAGLLPDWTKPNPRETKSAIAPSKYVCGCGNVTSVVMLTKSGKQIPVCKACTKPTYKGRVLNNPRGVVIYSDVVRIIARKGQKHICDAECRRKDHTYYHDFTPGSKIVGLPNKKLLIG